MASIENTFEGRGVIEKRARKGERLSDNEAESMTQQTADLGGVEDGNRDHFNPAQADWASKADQILNKPADTICTNDGRALQSRETKAFEDLPATGSITSHVQSIAEENER